MVSWKTRIIDMGVYVYGAAFLISLVIIIGFMRLVVGSDIVTLDTSLLISALAVIGFMLVMLASDVVSIKRKLRKRK